MNPSWWDKPRHNIARIEFTPIASAATRVAALLSGEIDNLMRRLQEQFGLTYIFISHNLSVVRHMSDDIAIMYLGRFVESGPAENIFADPRHPYTRLLLETIPNVDHPNRDRQPLAGEVPSPIEPPSGCPFHPRCPIVEDRCRIDRPELITRQGRQTACHVVPGDPDGSAVKLRGPA